MNFEVWRYSSGKDSTLGLLFATEFSADTKARDPFEGDEVKFLCYTLEDEHRTEKVYGETRIPAGTYPLALRTHGGFHERYSQKFPGWHIGMIEICDVPGFTDVLIHIGNDDDDTAGCLLVGDQAWQNVTDEGYVAASTSAYKRIYGEIAGAMVQAAAMPTITYRDIA